MAWAEKLPSGKWRGIYRDANGDRRTAEGGPWPRKQQAERAANAAEQAQRANPTDAATSRITWAQWEPVWWEGRKRADSTERSDRARCRDHLRPYWGDWELRRITPGDVSDWLTKMQSGENPPAASTITKCYYLLSASMKAAVAKRIIAVNPCKGIALPAPEPQPERFLEDNEYRAIHATLDDFDQFAADLLVGTGLRLGEAIALHWEDVDLTAETVSVRWSYDPVGRFFKAPKDYQVREVPVSPRLARSLQKRRDSEGYGLPCDLPYRGTRRVRSGLVLAHKDGRPMDSSNFRHRWEASARIAWVGKGKERRKVGEVRLHDLRHTYASRLLRAGVPIEEVSQLLGHGSITTTMRYKHLAQSHWDAVRKALA